MYISIKNPKEFPDEDFAAISQYLLSDRFRRQVELDYVNRLDEGSRTICEVNKKLYIVRHTEFSIPSVEDALVELHLSSVERYGFIDLFQVGTDANKNSILYWIIIPKSLHVLQTHIGMVCKNSDSNVGAPRTMARFDHLWIAGSHSSTVFALDLGSSHVVT